jgi:hypothetical protein
MCEIEHVDLEHVIFHMWNFTCEIIFHMFQIHMW